MKRLVILGVAACLCVPAAAFSRGGMSGGLGGGLGHGGGLEGTGSSALSLTRSAVTAGADTPGTNSLGTALSGSGTSIAVNGSLLGTGNPAIDRENERVEKKMHSICRGC